MTIDELDARLLATLRENPRVGLLEVARQLDVDPARMGYPVTAFVFLQITQGRLTEATAVLRGVPEVLEATAVSGPSDLLCRVVARDTEHLQEIVNELLTNPAIRRCTSYIVLSRQVPPRTGPLVSAAGGSGG